jgi:hypothetical protein
MLRAIWAAGRVDRTFLAARAQGWEEIEKQLGAEGRYPGLQEPLDGQRHQEQRQRAQSGQQGGPRGELRGSQHQRVTGPCLNAGLP